MRFVAFFTGVVVVVASLPAVANGQTGVTPTLVQPESIRQVRVQDDRYVDAGPVGASAISSPGVAAIPEPAVPAGIQGTLISAEQAPAAEADDAGPVGEPCPPPGPWKVPQPCVFQNLGIAWGGWIQQGITFNSMKPADRFNGPVTTNDRDREWQLNQAWFYFVKPTKTDGCGWDIGGRADVVYGTDWRYGQSYGLEDQINSSNSFYGLILPQFYAEVAVNNLTVKMGHFATMTSYEVIPPVANFFYSHSYLMAGYFDPLLATGLQADYKIGDNWTAVAGFNRGWEKFEDPINSLHFLGGVKWLSDDKRSLLSAMVDTGREVGFTGEHDRTSFITVFTHKFNDRLAYGSQYTVGREVGGSFVSPGDDADWYGTEQVLVYTINPKWSAAVRYEWVRDQDGSRIAGIGNVLLTDRGWDGLPGMTGSFHDVSLGLNYRPHPNMVLRPELRWDWYSGPPNPFGQLPFDNHTRSQQFLAAVDLLLTF